MAVALLERNPSGSAIVDTLDIRGDYTGEDAACEIRARDIGRSLIRWWAQAKRDWLWAHIDTTVRPPRRSTIDLRVELRKALSANYRISLTCHYLDVTEDGRSILRKDVMDHDREIGRDLIAWWLEQAKAARVDDRSLAAMLNESFLRFRARPVEGRG